MSTLKPVRYNVVFQWSIDTPKGKNAYEIILKWNGEAMGHSLVY